MGTGKSADSAVTGNTDALSTAITVTFGRNGALQTQTRTGMIDSTKNGKWTPVENASSDQPAAIECTLMQQTTRHEIEWIDADTIKMTPPNMAGLSIKLMFRRAQ